MPRRRTRKLRKTPKVGQRVRPRIHLRLGWLKPPRRDVLARASVASAWLGAMAGLLVACILGVPHLQAFASQHRSVDPHQTTIRFIDPPPWMKGDLADALLRTAQANVGGDPLVRHDLVAVRESLVATGWFESVDQVRRVGHEAVEVLASFVQPYTLIRDADGSHLVDIRARLLPKSYEPGAKTHFHFIAITGARFDRPQQPGQQWEGTDVVAGIKLLQLIDQQPWRDQVAEIDVSQHLRDGPIKLRTTTGCTIIWGGAPGEEPALEVLAEGKLERLKYLFERSGRIDANQGGQLDITAEKLVVTRSN